MATPPVTPEKWRADSEAVACEACSKRFTLTRRRHHCRSCGEVFCDDCALVRALGSAPAARACDTCVGVFLAAEVEAKLEPVQRQRRESLVLERKVSGGELSAWLDPMWERQRQSLSRRRLLIMSCR